MNHKLDEGPQLHKSNSNQAIDKMMVDKMYHTLTDGNGFGHQPFSRTTYNTNKNTMNSSKADSIFTKSKF